MRSVLARFLAAVVAISAMAVPASASAAPAPDGPRLLFSRTDIPAMRTKVTEPPASSWWATVHARADAALGRDVATTCERQLRYDLPDLAMSYLITGDARYGEKARDVLVHVDEAPQWRPNSANPSCTISWGDFAWRWPQLMAQTALADDWLRGSGLLSAQDEEAVRQDLTSGGQIVYDSLTAPEYDGADNYRNVTNYRLRNDGGLGIVGLALGNDQWSSYAWNDLFGDSGRGTPRYFDQMVAADGVYKEGQSYYQDSFRMLVPFFLAEKRVAGQDAFALPRVRKAFSAEPKLMMPDGSAPTVDTGWRQAQVSGGFGEWVAPQYPDDHSLLWGWQREGQPVPGADQWYSIINYDATLVHSAAPPRSPTQFLTSNQYAVLRSDWSPDAKYLLLNSERVPDRSPHEQPDQTSFALFADGAYLAVDPGDGRNCPGGDSYDRSAQAHNLVLVDGKGPRTTWDYTTALDPATLDLTGATPNLSYADTGMTYGASGAHITRGVLMPHGDYAVVLDELSSTAQHQYDWQLHLADSPENLTVDGDKASWHTTNPAGRTVTLDTYVAGPPGASWHQGVGVTNYTSGTCVNHPYVQVRSEATNARYAAVLYPHTADQAAPAVTQQRDGDSLIMHVDTSSHHDTLITGNNGQWSTHAGIGSDATTVFVSRTSEVESYLVKQGTKLVVDGQSYLDATGPVSAVVSYNAHGVTAHLTSQQPTRVTVHLPNGPGAVPVMVDGSKDVHFGPQGRS